MPYISLHDPARVGFKLTQAAFAILLHWGAPRDWGLR